MPPPDVVSAFTWQANHPDFQSWVRGRILGEEMAVPLRAGAATWRIRLHPDVARVVPPHYHGPLHKKALRATGIKDTLVDHVANGFPAWGPLPNTDLFPQSSKPVDTATLVNSLKAALRPAPALVAQALGRRHELPGMDTVRSDMAQGLAAGHLSGGFEAYRDMAGRVASKVPFDTYVAMARFLSAKQKADSSYECRPIDDATASGVNAATAAPEQTQIPYG